MRQALDRNLKYAKCTGFQLLKVEHVNQAQEDAIIKTQLRIQDGLKLQYEQEAANITAAMTVDISEANRKITIFQGQANAEATKITNEGEAKARQRTISSQGEAYKIAADITKQTPADTLMDYIYYTNLLNNKNATILVGVNRAMLSVTGKGY